MVKKVLWVDTETTGLDPAHNEITQLSCIYEEDGKEIDRFNCYMAPENLSYITKEALEVQGKTLEQLKEYPSKQMGFVKFVVGFLEKHVNRYDKTDKIVLAGQNIDFDKKFLYNFFCERGNKWFHSYFYQQMIDLKQFAFILSVQGLIKVKDVKLSTLAAECGFKFEHAHDAKYDIEMTRKVYKHYLLRFLNISEDENERTERIEKSETGNNGEQ